MSHIPLTDEEIEFVKNEIRAIGADESVFVFNHEAHINSSTCYNIQEDKVYVTKNVFPDMKYGSTHPRDLMSVRAVLAHEYYGHRVHREEYLSDLKKGPDFHATPLWQDECRASIDAARNTPNLTRQDKSNLIMDAIYRAQEYEHYIEMDDFMKEVVYGYTNNEKNISHSYSQIKFVSKSGQKGDSIEWGNSRGLSKVQHKARDIDEFER